MVELVVKLSQDLIANAKQGGSIASDALGNVLAEHGVTLIAPVEVAGEAAQYYRVEDVATEHIGALRDDLARLDGIEAAYVKPTDALP